MRVSLIVNVSASAVTPRVRVVIAQSLAAEHDLEVLQTAAPGHATELAAEAAADGREVVAVLGGDGTLNEAANGLAGTATTLAVLPGGSTNVMARTLGVKPDPVDATMQLIDTLRDPQAAWRRRVGLGSVNGRYFLFHASVGFDAAIVDRVERRSGLKRYASHPVFFLAALSTWFRHYDRRSPRFRVKASAGDVEDAYMAVFLNSNPYTYFGNRPLNLAPGTDLAGNALSAVVFRTLALRSLFNVAGRAMASGRRVARHPRITTLPDQAGFLVEGRAGPVPHQCDGEYLGEADHIDIAHHPGVLSLLTPLGPPPPAPRRSRWLRRRR
ncbi:MAG: diacylglycerol/lipid kinase family protein [Acidimicrobiales bacterium]